MTPDIPIRESISNWMDAFCGRDVDRLMALYAPDAIIFDAIPPYSSGVEVLRAKVLDCYQFFPEEFSINTQDLVIRTDENLATAHWFWRFTRLPEGHPAGQTLMRSSVVWQRRGEKWLIVHDHCSVPFDPETSTAVFTLNP